MNQQINLYQSISFEKKEPLSAKTMLIVFAVGFVAMILVYGYAQWHVLKLAHDLNESLALQTKAVQRLAELQRQYPPKRKSALLEQEIKRLSADRDAGLSLIDLFAAKTLGNTTGFSLGLVGLARQNMEGVWLRRIALGVGNKKWVLEGSALCPELVPRYLQQLAQEEVFAGQEFNKFQLYRPDDQPACVDFLLETTTGAGK